MSRLCKLWARPPSTYRVLGEALAKQIETLWRVLPWKASPRPVLTYVGELPALPQSPSFRYSLLEFPAKRYVM